MHVSPIFETLLIGKEKCNSYNIQEQLENKA